MMKYGCIGEHLPHSFSKEIHAHLASNDYRLCELTPEELPAFMERRDFCGINVTIPYKKAVIPFLDWIDDAAREIGAVNTIVNREGRLYGYNTDFEGMRMMIRKEGIDPNGKKVLVLGTGGTSVTARAVAASMGAREVLSVSRSAKDGAVDYQTVYEAHTDAEIIINTTPCGMYPNIEGMPIDVSAFPRLAGVVDAVYNPLCTRLVLEARAHGALAVGGLYMLVAQAVKASSYFTGMEYGEDTVDDVFAKIYQRKQNVVLVGMPGCGKSTVGRLLAESMNKKFVDTDELVVSMSGKSISQIFAEQGEAAFRDLESEAISRAASEGGCIIATGGGAVLREENVTKLRQNGRIYFLDRPLEELIPTDDRPLAKTVESIKRRYEERYDIYCSCADEIVKTLGDPALTAAEIQRRDQI